MCFLCFVFRYIVCVDGFLLGFDVGRYFVFVVGLVLDFFCCFGLVCVGQSVVIFRSVLCCVIQSDVGFVGDYVWFFRFFCCCNGCIDGFWIVVVDFLYMLVGGFEVLYLVGFVRQFYCVVDGDIVVILEDDQFVQIVMVCNVDGFLGDVFYQVIVVSDYIGVVVDQFFVVLCLQDFFGDGEVDGIGNILFKWVGGGFDCIQQEVFRVICSQ